MLANHFVGRSPELQQLDDALEQLGAGGAVALEVLGAAGIGKTRLLGELAARADARGHIVLSGSGSDLERDLAVLGLRRRARRVHRERRAAAGSPTSTRRCGSSSRTSSRHSPSSGRGGSPGLQDERYRTNRAVRELLERLAATKPLVLILDDFHWADPASVDLLASLLHRPPDAAVLIALGARPNQGPPRLAGALDRAIRDGELTRIELDPLSSEEAAAMLGQEQPNPLTTALYEESGGNPFYLEQLARAPEGTAVPAAGDVSVSGVQVPPMVAAALTEELALLSESSRRVLDGASVAGDPFEPELAAAAAGVSEQQTIEAIDELLERDLVRLTDRSQALPLPASHRSARRLRGDAGRLAHRRPRAHAQRPSPTEARAPQSAPTTSRSPPRSGRRQPVSTLAEAGQPSAQRAPATAARWFSGALRLLGRRRAVRAASRAAAGQRHGAGGDRPLRRRARSSAREPRHRPRRGGLASRSELAATCARVEHLLGLHDEAHARLTSALDDLPDAAGPEAVTLMLELAADASVSPAVRSRPGLGRARRHRRQGDR